MTKESEREPSAYLARGKEGKITALCMILPNSAEFIARTLADWKKRGFSWELMPESFANALMRQHMRGIPA